MLAYITKRLAHAAIVLLIVSVAVFTLIHSAPGGPALLLAPELGEEQVSRVRRLLGLDDPLPAQYLRWLTNAVSGRFGNSFSLGIPVADVIAARLGNSLVLVTSALSLAIVVGIPLGVLSALKRHGFTDRAVTLLSLFGLSVPVFWLGLLAIMLFAAHLSWLPAGGIGSAGPAGSSIFFDRLRHLILPSAVLGIRVMAEIARYTRAGMIEVMSADYVRTAYAKGLKGQGVIYKHALKNAVLPVVTMIGLLFPQLISNAAITETVFSWPGFGRLAVDAASARDYPMVMGVTIVASVFVVVSNLVVDLSYALLDPRIRYK